MLQSDIYENWSQIPSISSNRNHLPGVFRWIFCSKSLSCFPSLFSSWCSVTLSLSAGLLERLVTSNSVLPSLRHSLPPVCPLLLSLYMSLPNSSSVGLLERSALNPDWLLCSIHDRKAENSKLSQKGRSRDAKDRDRKIRKEGRRKMSCRPGGGKKILSMFTFFFFHRHTQSEIPLYNIIKPSWEPKSERTREDKE